MNSQPPLVTAVIVTYNSRDHIDDALSTLRTSKDLGIAECVVVDNASWDGTADFVAANHPWVTLVRSEHNLGFGRGCNKGFRLVQTPYVLILNPDVVMDHKTIEILVDFMESHEQIGITAPATIIDGEEGLQAAGLMTTPSSIMRAALGFRGAMPEKQRIAPGAAPFRTSWVCGAVMLIRSELFERLGGFDPRFFLYFEETDLCRRASQEGAEIWAVGEAVARHIGGACAKSSGEIMTSSCISGHFYRSRFYYLVKHFGWFQAVGSELLEYAAQHLRKTRDWLSGKRRSQPPGRGRRPLLSFPPKSGDQ